MNARAGAARVLLAVVANGQSLSAAMANALLAIPAAERGLAQELCYGVLRFYPRLLQIAGGLLHKPLKPKDLDVQQLILIGLYQLIYLKIPAHAAVTETVDATRWLDKAWAAGLMNALLRNFQREAERHLAKADQIPSARTAHPSWWLAQLQTDWPHHWQDIIAANNQRPPMTLRVNVQRQSRDAYQASLAREGIIAHAIGTAPTALILDTPVDVGRLPGFADGLVSVQDAAAQLAAPLLDLGAGQSVLDACAAPGGKSAHILECEPQVRLLALDRDASRLTRAQDTLQRLHLSAELCRGDASQPYTWWEGKPFDRILLDAPCSGSGVIRRHPDIKLLRTAQDIDSLARQQRALLAALWPLLAPGGILVYATCSVLPAENRQNVAAFLAQNTDAREYPIDADWGYQQTPGRQILPGEFGMDGFYYARLMKS